MELPIKPIRLDKPCPHCGNIVEYQYNAVFKMHAISCEACDCVTFYVTRDITTQEVIDKWNRTADELAAAKV